MNSLQILYRDTDYIAIYKPHGLLVHRRPETRDREFALQLLRSQIGARIYPLHRLDRATAGIVLFALNPPATRLVSEQFRRQQVQKLYLALVRGYTPEQGCIDHPLKREEHKPPRPARTFFCRMQTVEHDFAVGPHTSARYSLVVAMPKSGRHHQLRRHFNHIAHPIIGDTSHGDGRQNFAFRERFGIRRLMLFAYSIRFWHPCLQKSISIAAPLEKEIEALFQRWKLSVQLPTIDKFEARIDSLPPESTDQADCLPL